MPSPKIIAGSRPPRRQQPRPSAWSGRLRTQFKGFDRPIGQREKLRLIGSVSAGMSAQVFRSIGSALPLSSAQWAGILALPKVRTTAWLSEDANGGRLTRQEAEQVKLVALVFLRAVDVLGNEGAAVAWLNAPLDAFKGKKPLELLGTSTGADLVLEQLGRMEHGVYF